MYRFKRKYYNELGKCNYRYGCCKPADNTPVDADGTINVTGGKIVDLNGNEIDYSRQMGPGGPKGPEERILRNWGSEVIIR